MTGKAMAMAVLVGPGDADAPGHADVIETWFQMIAEQPTMCLLCDLEWHTQDSAIMNADTSVGAFFIVTVDEGEITAAAVCQHCLDGHQHDTLMECFRKFSTIHPEMNMQLINPPHRSLQ